MLTTMKDVFVSCQTSVSVHQKLLKALQSIYDARDGDAAFFGEFVRLLHHALVRGDKSAPAERTLEFVARFARHLCPTAAEPDETTDEPAEVHPFFGRLVEFLVDSHRAGEQAVRVRICQLLSKLLLHLGENAYLEDAICERVYAAMLERLRDTAPAVRVQAVFALSRLQEPQNKKCPVILAYLFHLSSDPSADVRRAVLLNLCGTAATVPHVLQRTRDSSAAVRRRAFLFLTNVHIKSIPMGERRRLLREGLQDSDATVRRTVQKDLLQFWLRLLNSSVTQLLRCLYVEMCPDVAELVVRAICRETSYADMTESLALLAESRLPAVDQLTPERVLLWRVLCEHLRAEGGGADSQLERISPAPPALCTLVQQLSGRAPADGQHEAHWFVLRQLIELACGLELWDEFGRRSLAALVDGLLRGDHVHGSLVAPLVRLYARAVPAAPARLRALIETISEIRAPLQVSPPAGPAAAEPTEQQERERRLRRAQLRVRQNELSDQLEAAVAGGDFATAQQVQRQQAQCQEEEQRLQEPQPPEPSSPTDGSGEECPERDDPATLVKCLTVLYELLQTAELTKLTPELRALAETLVLPAVLNEDPDVREAAVRALGVLCLLDRAFAEQYLVLFVQVGQVDQSEVQQTALRAVFDQLTVHGLAVAAPPEEADQLAPLVTELIAMLDVSDAEVRGLVAEGLCKLLTHGRVSSARLLERLVLMWYNPVMDGDSFLRNMLGVFFPAFGAASRHNQEQLAEAMLPTLVTLLQAPMTSPLVEVDVDDVALFFVQLTQSAMLPPHEAALPGSVHEALAYRLLNALLDGTGGDLACRVLARSLTQLVLTASPAAALRDIVALADRALDDAAGDRPELAAGRQAARYLRKLRGSAATLLAARADEPLPTPAATRQRRVSAASADSGEEVELIAGLDCSQGSPAKEPPETGPTDLTDDQVFLGAASVSDSDEFSTRVADESSARPADRRAALSRTQKRAAETPPPARRPGARLSRCPLPAPKRGKHPTGSPSTVPPKRTRPNVRRTPAANVRRTPAARARAQTEHVPASDDSPATISVYDSGASDHDSPGAAPAPKGGRQRKTAAACKEEEPSPDSVVTGKHSARSTGGVDDSPDVARASRTRRAAKKQEQTPDSVVSGVSQTRRGVKNKEEQTPESVFYTASRTRRGAKTQVEDTPDSVVSVSSRTRRGGKSQVEDSPESVVSTASRTRRGTKTRVEDSPESVFSAASGTRSKNYVEQTPDSVVSGTSSARRPTQSQAEVTPDSVLSGTTRAGWTQGPAASSANNRKSTRKASTRKV